MFPDRRIAWPGLRRVLFQLHWFVGITVGSVLVVVGLSGALLAFRAEIVDLVTPGGRQVASAGEPVLAPQQLLLAAQTARREGRVATMLVSAEAGRAARVTFAPEPGKRRGETIYLDPYTGAVLPRLAAEPFFDWVESLHRWLLLPREPGRVATGILAFGLLGLSLSGIYLRWPRKPMQWRAWLGLDTTLRGRPFLWALHAVTGTWALVVYLALTTTGLYWAYDWIRDPVDRAAGVVRPPRPAGMRAEAGTPPIRQAPPDLAAAWEAFKRRAADSGGWDEASLRLPAGGGPTVQINWRAPDAPHERARNTMTLRLPDGAVARDERYAAKPAAQRALTVIYPLHMGSYFGLPGRIAVFLASLALPLFVVTGWMLYLDRRRKRRDIARQQAALDGAADARAGAGGPPLLLAHASQTGTAEAIALRTAAALRQAGVAVTLLPFAQVDPERLRHFPRLLLVASSFGDGEAPDSARRAARLLAAAAAPALAHLQYGLLALGDRHYAQFCGFGHTLDHALESAGATRLFPMIEVDDGDARALERWHLALAGVAGVDVPAADGQATGAGFDTWRLQSRKLLNPGSPGAPLYRVDLVPAGDTPMPASAWPPGAVVEIRPRHAAVAVRHLLVDAGFDPDAPVRQAGQRRSLVDAVSHAAWPAPDLLAGRRDPQALADALTPLATRRYSVASLPVEGRLSLLVRQVRHEGGLGLASGWLTAHAPVSAGVSLRLLDNPAFAPVEDDGPAIFIGNGAGYAGLRSHLLHRVTCGRRRNWLLLGERRRASDAFCGAEVARWQADGFLPHADLVFSRDQPARRYVQDELLAQAERLRRWVEEGACIYVCGSLRTMGAGVDAALAELLGAEGVDTLIASGRYRRDVY